MSTSTLGFSPQPEAVGSYAKNVAVAARNFVAALLAVKPANAGAQAATADTAAAAAGKPASSEFSLFRLYCLASRASLYDSVSPKLARELQLIASRG